MRIYTILLSSFIFFSMLLPVSAKQVKNSGELSGCWTSFVRALPGQLSKNPPPHVTSFLTYCFTDDGKLAVFFDYREHASYGFGTSSIHNNSLSMQYREHSYGDYDKKSKYIGESVNINYTIDGLSEIELQMHSIKSIHTIYHKELNYEFPNKHDVIKRYYNLLNKFKTLYPNDNK